MPVMAWGRNGRTPFAPTVIHWEETEIEKKTSRATQGRPYTQKGEVQDLAFDFLYYFLASRAEIDSIIFDIFSSAFASFAFSASISCAGAFARKP